VHSTNHGVISWGMVAIPVRMFASVASDAGVSFHMLHDACKGRLKQQYVCPACHNAVVGRAETVKGFESGGGYTVFTEDELKAVVAPDAARKDEVAITEFVPANAVAQVYRKSVTYLGPDKGGARAFALLSVALNRTGTVALGWWVSRGHDHAVMIMPVAEPDDEHGRFGLAMVTLHWPESVRAYGDVPGLTDVLLTDGEIALADQLVRQGMVTDFDPTRYRNPAVERVACAVATKEMGREAVRAAPVPPGNGDASRALFERLQASLGPTVTTAPKAKAAAAKRKRTAKRITAAVAAGVGKTATKSKKGRARA
jgi:DNA end-binding protein Ku